MLFTDTPLPKEFNEWMLPSTLAPLPLSAEAVAQFESLKVEAVYKATSAQDVADCLNWVSQENKKITLGQHVSSEAIVLDISQLNQIETIHLEDMAVSVQTGITWGQLQQELSQYGRWIPLSYPSETKLLDILADDMPALETGSLNYPGGYPRDYVIGIELATTDGRLNRYGGLVVKNATGYDLNKLYIGADHRFGVLTSVILKLFTKPAYVKTYQASASFQELNRLSGLLQEKQLPVQWLEIVISKNSPDTNGLFLQLAGHDAVVIENADARFKQLVLEQNIVVNEIQADAIWASDFVCLANQPCVELAYTAQGHQDKEAYWYAQIQEQFSASLPDYVCFRPMASYAKLIWNSSNPVNASFKAELKGLHQKLVGNNPYGVPEGFLRVKNILAVAPSLCQGNTLLDVLSPIYDPNRILAR